MHVACWNNAFNIPSLVLYIIKYQSTQSLWGSALDLPWSCALQCSPIHLYLPREGIPFPCHTSPILDPPMAYMLTAWHQCNMNMYMYISTQPWGLILQLYLHRSYFPADALTCLYVHLARCVLHHPNMYMYKVLLLMPIATLTHSFGVVYIHLWCIYMYCSGKCN